MGPLYARSEYSLLQSTLRVDAYVNQLKHYGYSYGALCDHNVLYGAKKFNMCCKQNGIKPLFGIEFEIMMDRVDASFEALAMDNEGYVELIHLSSAVNEGKVGIDVLSGLNHCVLIAFNDGGIFENAVLNQDMTQFQAVVETIRHYHPHHNYLALCYQQTRYWANANAIAFKMATALNFPCVGINRTFYLTPDQAQAYLVVNAIRMDKTISDATLVPDNDRYLLSMNQYTDLYPESVLKNHDGIASLCNVDLDGITTSLPAYPLPKGTSSKDYLKALALKGLKKRLHCDQLPTTYQNRLGYELSVIETMGFSDYFLIVFDYIRFAKKKGILVGPGRGSAAGSLVSYAIGITEIDPIHYNLLFERFLNPARVSMPDIDTDIPDDRRDEVIEYCVNKYGLDHVAHILTFGTLAAKQVLRDVAKVYGLANYDIDRLTKTVPNTQKITLSHVVETSKALAQLIYENPKIKTIVDIALQLEGLPRHCSTHAGGIVFSSKPFDQCTPTLHLNESMLTTQYTMEYMEDMGLIKMDILGLRNLTILDTIRQSVRWLNHDDFDLNQIPLDDPSTFRLIQHAQTIGIFQLESEGMRNLLRRMKPNCFNDVVLAVALYRPGPMELIGLYLKNRADGKKRYDGNEKIDALLQETCGIMVYQEQVMQISQIVAGFSLGQADILRKAMSKKKADQIERLKDDFIKGALNNGYTMEKATHWFDQIQRFAGYGFNKAHSVAYGLIAYQLAYLKVHQPLAFYGAFMNSIIGSMVKTNAAMMECRNHGIELYCPSLNTSGYGFTIENHGLRFPFSAIKGVGSVLIQSILNDRKRFGPYTGYGQTIARLVALKCNKATIETLIDAGCLDDIDTNRYMMKINLDDAMRYGDLVIIHDDGDQYHFDFDLLSMPRMVSVKEDANQRALNEAKALGVFVSSNPYANKRNQYGLTTTLLASLNGLTSGYAESFGMIERIKPHRTKKGDMMAFVTFSDESGTLDASIMPDLYAKVGQALTIKTYARFRLRFNPKGAMVQTIESLR